MNELIALYLICFLFMLGAMYSRRAKGMDSLVWFLCLLLAPLTLPAYIGSRVERLANKFK